MNISPSTPQQTLVPVLNGVTEVRLEMLTNVGEVIFTNRIQEIPWKGGENPETGITPQYKPVMSHLQQHVAAPAPAPVPAPAPRGSKKNTVQLQQLQRKEIQREEANVVRASQQGMSKQARLFSPNERHPGRPTGALYNPGGWGRLRGCCSVLLPRQGLEGASGHLKKKEVRST